MFHHELESGIARFSDGRAELDQSKEEVNRLKGQSQVQASVNKALLESLRAQLSVRNADQGA